MINFKDFTGLRCDTRVSNTIDTSCKNFTKFTKFKNNYNCYLILVGPCQPLNPCNNGGTCASTDGIVLRGLKTFYFILIK